MFIPKDTTQPEPPVSNPLGFEALTNRLYLYVEGLTSSQRNVQGGIWLLIAAFFMVAASLPLPGFLSWLVPIIGVPGGLILYALAVSFVRVTNLKTWRVFNVKDWAVPRQRVTYVAIGGIIALAILIVIGRWLPTGIGGSLIVLLALTGFNTIRRTPYELELAAKGIPDPRELETEVYEEELYEEPENEPFSSDTDDSLGQGR